MSELEDIREEALADDIEINYAKMCSWSAVQARAYFENNGVMPPRWAGGGATAKSAASKANEASGASQLLLPYLIGAAPAACCPLDADGWRGLRAATVRAEHGECKHGFSALGLSAGCVLSVLTTLDHAVRSVLGSAQPKKLVLRLLKEVHDARTERIKRKKVDDARFATLADMHREMNTMDADMEEQRMAIDKAARDGGSRTRIGEFRGPCKNCSCLGFCAANTLPHGSRLWHTCVGCGCPATDHVRGKER